MSESIGIVGAGLMGRMLGEALSARGWQITLFDKDEEQVTGSVSWASAGMIAPSCELESAEAEIALLGTAALEAWPHFVQRLEEPVDFRVNGSIVVAHQRDQMELERLRKRIAEGAPNPEQTRTLSGTELRELEPELHEHFQTGLFMAFEGQVDNRKVLTSLATTLRNRGATIQTGRPVTAMEPGVVHVGEERYAFDWVADCRGMGARADVKGLRGVRGELIYISAPDVSLHRPVRLMHPRYPIYIVPRENGVYVIGATALESEDYSPVSVRSALELLSAAYTVHPGFAEGRILEMLTNCRPAFPDNRPRIFCQEGLVRINGLYRHGFLLAPKVSEFAADFIESRRISEAARPIIVEAAA